MIFELYVNLNERGYVYCDMRDPDGKTVWEVSGDWDEIRDYDGSGCFDPTSLDCVRNLLLKPDEQLIRGN